MGSSYFMGALVVLVCTIAAPLGLLFVRKNWIKTGLGFEFHEAAGSMLQVVGTLYALVLGLSVVDSMNALEEGRHVAESEANCVLNIFHLAAILPESERKYLQGTCLAYVIEVKDNEWNDMEKSQMSDKAQALMKEIGDVILSFEPKTNKEEIAFENIIEEAKELGDFRRQRLLSSTNGVPFVLWLTLIVGAMITVAYTYYLEFSSNKIQIILTTMYSLMLALNIFLIWMFGYPFSGEVKVKPTAFAFDIKLMQKALGDKVNNSLDFSMEKPVNKGHIVAGIAGAKPQ